MSTTKNRPRHNRDQLRYPGDLAVAEWAHIKPLIPPAKRGGKRRVWPAPGGQRRDVRPEHRMPVAPHPKGPATAQRGERLLLSVERQRHAGEDSRRALHQMSRASRARGQPDCLYHRQPTREKRGKRGACIDPPGFDAGKLIKGKKRHVLVDRLGLLLRALVAPADVQDRDGGLMALSTLFRQFPFLKKLFADSAYAGPVFRDGLAIATPNLITEIVRQRDRAKGLVVLPQRWIVERTIAWLNRCRRFAKDWENLNHNALAFLRLASIRLVLRKLCYP
jgi:putative transposase